MVIAELDLRIADFVPMFKCATGHTQTLLGHFFPSPTFTEKHTVHLLEFPDGDHCALQVFENKKENKKNIVLSLYHGLGGDHTSDYMQRAARRAFDLGWTVVLVDHRGAGLAAGRARLPYHSGRGEDVSNVLKYLRERFQDSIQVAIGFSMSGNILLNLICERSGEYKPDYAVVVHAPIDLADAAELLTRGFSRVYDFRFYQKLRLSLKKNYNFKVPLTGFMHEIDDLFTSKKSGFKNKEDYYDRCSTYRYLQNIITPTFVLIAADDPFVSFEVYKKQVWPQSVHRTYSKFGGHMGYFSKNELISDNINFKKRWLDQYLHRVFLTIEENISYLKT